MKTIVILSLISTSVMLMGCAETGSYPVTGHTVSDFDQVKFMSAPEITRY